MNKNDIWNLQIYSIAMIDKVAIFVGLTSAFLIGFNICVMIQKLRNN